MGNVALTVLRELHGCLQPLFIAAHWQSDKDPCANACDEPQDEMVRLYLDPPALKEDC